MLKVEYNDPDLTLRDRPTNWGGGVYLYKGQPFNGVEIYHYEGTRQLSAEYEYKEGIFDGRQLKYWRNGNLKEEFFRKFDYYVGSFKRWDEDGQLISHQEFDEFGNWIETIL